MRRKLKTRKQSSEGKVKTNLYVVFSRVKCNSSRPKKLAEIALNQCSAHTNSKVEHVASMVYCNVNTSKISAALTRLKCDVYNRFHERYCLDSSAKISRIN